MKRSNEIVINPKLFEPFGFWSGWVPVGYWANWLGVLTRAEVWDFPDWVLEIYSKRRYEQFGYPTKDEHVLDWVPMLEAVLAAGDTFVMIALGCGWGRWLSGGAFAARKIEKSYRLVGVEAEPDHFNWMKIHFKENGIDPSHYRAINAAAAGHSGYCWFYVGKPQSWYGQSIVQDESVQSSQSQASNTEKKIKHGMEMEYKGEIIKRIRCVDLKKIISRLKLVDYLHMDVQGSEYEILSAHPKLLRKRVKMVNVGTHSEDIGNQLRDLFNGLGWENRYNINLDSEVLVKVGDKEIDNVKFGDGVQVWVNPTLSD